MFGMLTQVEEGKLHLEDEDAHIELIMHEAVGRIGNTDQNRVTYIGLIGI